MTTVKLEVKNGDRVKYKPNAHYYSKARNELVFWHTLGSVLYKINLKDFSVTCLESSENNIYTFLDEYRFVLVNGVGVTLDLSW